MKIRALALGAAIGFVAAIAPSCGPAKCGPQNCAGCCTADDKCVGEPNNANPATCGREGNDCATCATGEVCNGDYVCAGSANTGGGTAGGGSGGGSGGGTAGGGSGGGTAGGGSGGGSGGNCVGGCLAPNGTTCVRPNTQTVSVCGNDGGYCGACPNNYACDNGQCTAPPNVECATIKLVHDQFPTQTTVEDNLAFLTVSNGDAIYGALLGSNTGAAAPLYDLIQIAASANPTSNTVDFADQQNPITAIVFQDAYNCPSSSCTSSPSTSTPFLATAGTLTFADGGAFPLTRPFIGSFSNVRFVQVNAQTGAPIPDGGCLNLVSGDVSIPAPNPAPAGWQCNGNADAGDLYDDGICHCGCSAPAADGGVINDLDCTAGAIAACSAGWTCDLDYYNADDGCDCGCGAVDLDCATADGGAPTVAACNWCDACGQTSQNQSCSLFINPNDITACKPDGGTTVDAGTDAGTDVDAGTDAGSEVDAGEVDAGEVDAGEVDAGEVDAGEVDAGEVDAGEVDAG